MHVSFSLDSHVSHEDLSNIVSSLTIMDKLPTWINTSNVLSQWKLKLTYELIWSLLNICPELICNSYEMLQIGPGLKIV